MKRVLCIAVAVLLVLTGCANSHAALAASLPTMTESIAESKKSADDLKDLVQWLVEDLEEEEEQSDEDAASTDEAAGLYGEKLEELKDIREDIGKLARDVEDLKAQDVEQYDSTLEAANEYFSELDGVAADQGTIIEYYISVLEAIRPIEEFDDSPGGDVITYVKDISDKTSETIENMQSVKFPPFMESSHQDLVARLGDFQIICDDLVYAIEINDPLRIASCDKRMDRWNVMFEDSVNALNADCKLQFEQSAKRLDGRITTLRKELQKNIKALEEAVS